MATITSRINSSGTYFVNGTFDEFTGVPIADSSLVLWLDASQPASYSGTGNTWTSISSVSSTITLFNSPTFTTSNGGVISFDGVDDYVDFDIQDSATTVSVITVEMWVKINGTGARMPFGFTGYDVYLSGGNLAYNTGASDLYGIPAATVTSLGIVGNWKHLVFVMQNNTSLSVNPYTNNKIYVDGVAQSLSQISNTQSGSTRTFNNGVGRISGWNNDLNYKALMDLAVFKIYNRELTAEEIQQNYNALNSRFSLAPIASVNSRTSTKIDTILAREFDEVNMQGAGVAKRETSTGTILVSGIFDEFTGAPVVDSSLVLWLDAAQSTSYSGAGTTFVDISNAANSGTLIGTIPFSPIDSGGSFSFDGGNNYVGNFATPLVRTGSRTIESWFQISTNAVRMGLAGDRDGTGWIFCVNRNLNGSLSYNHAGAGGTEDFNFAANVPVNTWTNAVVTYDVASATVTIYMNGNLLGTSSSFTPIVPATTPVSYVGWETNSSKFQGKIAATKIYNRALTADEVQQNFNALRRRYGI